MYIFKSAAPDSYSIYPNRYLEIYRFSYIGNATKYVGVMAHEVPWASEKHSNGYLMVDYDKLDVDFKRFN